MSNKNNQTKIQYGMVIDPTALAALRKLATETESFPLSGPGAKKGEEYGAVSIMLERIVDNPSIVATIKRYLK